MISGKIGALDLSDIEALIDSETAESRTLEFKRELSIRTDEEKREFLADVSALANTIGGDIVFGLDAADGVAKEVKPVAVANIDAEQQRLEAIIRSGLEPRLLKVDFRWVPSNGGHVLVLRVPQSWQLPHRVSFRDHSKFYARSTSGKYPMDVAELRAAFNSAGGLVAKINGFRRERIQALDTGECPVVVDDGPKLLFHVIPASSLADGSDTNINMGDRFRPIRSRGYNFLHTLEGLTTFTGPNESAPSRAYTLGFRNGIVEAVAHVGRENQFIYPSSIEGGLLGVADSYFQGLELLDVPPPFYIGLTLVAVRGFYLKVPDHVDERGPLRRDTLFFPNLVVEEARPDAEKILRPVFDLLWQSFGFARSYNFDSAGRYTGE